MFAYLPLGLQQKTQSTVELNISELELLLDNNLITNKLSCLEFSIYGFAFLCFFFQMVFKLFLPARQTATVQHFS